MVVGGARNYFFNGVDFLGGENRGVGVFPFFPFS